jgi:hypothetical protein
MQVVKVKGWGKADVTSAAIAAYLNKPVHRTAIPLCSIATGERHIMCDENKNIQCQNLKVYQ